ncbi:MAG: hypothetical protein WCC48_07125 [Anaeromyxobacteraceae bacterium]
MSLAELHERLLSWATAEPRTQDLLTARAEHYARYGEPREDELTYEPRVNGMLDHYLYDFRPNGQKTSTLENFISANGTDMEPSVLEAYRRLTQSVHGLFEVRKITDGLVVLRDVFADVDHQVAERRQLAGLKKGDLIEARLLPFEDSLVFSGAHIYHPTEMRKQILAEVKRLRKEAGRAGRPDVKAFLAILSRMAFKLERYRNVRLESIYDFSAGALALTPRPPPKV